MKLHFDAWLVEVHVNLAPKTLYALHFTHHLPWL